MFAGCWKGEESLMSFLLGLQVAQHGLHHVVYAVIIPFRAGDELLDEVDERLYKGSSRYPGSNEGDAR